MACEMRVHVVEPDGSIQAVHIFYGADEQECEAVMVEHMAGCRKFALAEADDRVLTEVEEIDEDDLPSREDFDEETDDEEEDEEETEEV